MYLDCGLFGVVWYFINRFYFQTLYKSQRYISCSVYFRNVWCELAKSTSCQKHNPKGLNGSAFGPYSAMLVEFCNANGGAASI